MSAVDVKHRLKPVLLGSGSGSGWGATMPEKREQSCRTPKSDGQLLGGEFEGGVGEDLGVGVDVSGGGFGAHEGHVVKGR